MITTSAIRVPLDQSHALVTGAARGIGLATVRRLLKAGGSVTMWDIDKSVLESSANALVDEGFSRDAIATRRVDITEFSTLEGHTKEAIHALGPIDILVNNAGHLAPGNFTDQDPETWMKTLSINVDALVYLTRVVISMMYEQRRGHVVNISSAAGAIGVPGLSVYSASKWAVWGFSEALRAEARRHNVLVSSIHPSYVATGMFAGAKLTGLGNVLVPRLPSHDAVAEAVVETALRRGKTRVMRPRSVRLAVLFRGVLPDRWFNGLMRFLGVWESMSGWRGPGRPEGGSKPNGGN